MIIEKFWYHFIDNLKINLESSSRNIKMYHDEVSLLLINNKITKMENLFSLQMKM